MLLFSHRLKLRANGLPIVFVRTKIAILVVSALCNLLWHRLGFYGAYTIASQYFFLFLERNSGYRVPHAGIFYLLLFTVSVVEIPVVVNISALSL